jgi:hypothetical protein
MKVPMKTILAALAAAVLLSSAAPAGATEKTKEGWTHTKSSHRVSGTAAHHSATVHPAANAMAGGQGFYSPNYASSSLPAYGGSLASGPSRAGSVKPLRPMARSRTSGAGAFVAGGSAQGHTYTTVQASPASASVSSAGGSKIQMGRNGRALSGQGVAQGDADTAPGGANNTSNGSDPLSKIVAGLGSMFGDMAKSMSAMWGGGG